MAQNLTEAEIREVVSQTLNKLYANSYVGFDSTQYSGRKFTGIFDDMNDAIEQAQRSYKIIRAMSVEQREKIIPVPRLQ